MIFLTMYLTDIYKSFNGRLVCSLEAHVLVFRGEAVSVCENDTAFRAVDRLDLLSAPILFHLSPSLVS